MQHARAVSEASKRQKDPYSYIRSFDGASVDVKHHEDDHHEYTLVVESMQEAVTPKKSLPVKTVFGAGKSYMASHHPDDNPAKINATLLIELLEEVRRFVAGEVNLAPAEVSMVEQKVRTVQAEISRCEAVAAPSLGSGAGGQDMDIAELLARLAKLEKEVEQLTTENSSLKELNADLQAENSTLKDDVSRLESLNAELQDQVNQLEAENAKLQAEITQMKVAMEKLKAELKHLQEENNRLKDENKRLQGEINKLKAEIARLQDEIAALQELVTQLQDQIAKLEAEIAKLREELLEAQAQINALKKALALAQSGSISLENLAKILADLEAERARRAKVEAMLLELLNELSSLLKQLPNGANSGSQGPHNPRMANTAPDAWVTGVTPRGSGKVAHLDLPDQVGRAKAWGYSGQVGGLTKLMEALKEELQSSAEERTKLERQLRWLMVA